MPVLQIRFDSDQIKNCKDEAEELWALDAAMDVYNAAVDIMNPLVHKYNELWDGIDINATNDDGTINEEAPYVKAYDEYQKLMYDAMSYIYGVNPKTRRIVKLDYPYILVNDQTGQGKIFAHIEDFEM